MNLALVLFSFRLEVHICLFTNYQNLQTPFGLHRIWKIGMEKVLVGISIGKGKNYKSAKRFLQRLLEPWTMSPSDQLPAFLTAVNF